MNKLLVVIFLSFFSSFLDAKPLFQEYKTQILETDGVNAVIADSPEFVVGASGIVIHKFDDKTTSIIKRVDVISKNNGKATVRFDTFKMLSQGAFPNTGIMPIVGDQVVINYLYSRALIIVPNQDTFRTITKEYDTIAWVHPDIVAGYLAKLYRPNPDKEIFQQACYQNTASLIFFGIKDTGYFVDCHNFNTLKSIKITENSDIQVPFYTRIPNIDSSWFSMNSSKISDYNSYYAELLRK